MWQMVQGLVDLSCFNGGTIYDISEEIYPGIPSKVVRVNIDNRNFIFYSPASIEYLNKIVEWARGVKISGYGNLYEGLPIIGKICKSISNEHSNGGEGDPLHYWIEFDLMIRHEFFNIGAYNFRIKYFEAS